MNSKCSVWVNVVLRVLIIAYFILNVNAVSIAKTSFSHDLFEKVLYTVDKSMKCDKMKRVFRMSEQKDGIG